MGRRNLPWVFFLWGVVAFLCLPLISHFQKKHFQKTEKLFVCAIPNQENTAHVRSDDNGKGYFGAPRNGGRVHDGIDLLAGVGEPVFAAKSGRVVRVIDSKKGYGKYIEIQHPDGLKSLYAHLSAMNVKTRDWVDRGRMIGKVGKTGNAASSQILPHLHFEVRDHDKPVNPTPLISYKLT